jgi:hypothetical protein
MRDAGIVDQDVEPPEPINRGAHHSPGVGVAGDVGLHGPRTRDLRRDPLGRSTVDVGDHHLRPFACGEFGCEVTPRRLTRDDIYIADEAFFTGTAAEVTPIRELDNRTIGEGKRGPLTAQIQARFFDVVNGRAPEYEHWLSFI